MAELERIPDVFTNHYSKLLLPNVVRIKTPKVRQKSLLLVIFKLLSVTWFQQEKIRIVILIKFPNIIHHFQ